MPVRISWLDSAGLPSHIHLTEDGEKTLCDGEGYDHAQYIASRELVKSPNREKGRSLYCRICFMGNGKKYSHSLPWDKRCKDRDPNMPPWWTERHVAYRQANNYGRIRA